MDRSQIKTEALRRMRQAGKKPHQLTFLSLAISVAVSIAVGIVGTVAEGYQGGEGLSGMGTASLLQAVEQSLRILVQLATPFWSVGLVTALFAITLGEDASRDTLPEGFRRFLPFLRLYLLKGVYIAALAMVLYLPASVLYSFTPWGLEFQAALTENPDLINGSMEQLLGRMLPLFLIYGILLLVVLVPRLYRLRLADYFMVSGWNSAMMALVTSNRLTKGRVKELFLLDLSFWWYYVAKYLLLAVCYLDVLMGLFGYRPDMDPQLAYWLCYFTYAVGLVALETYARPGVEGAKVLQFRYLADSGEMPQI